MEINTKTTNFLIASFSLVIILVFAFLWYTKPPKTFIFPQKMPTKEARRLAGRGIETTGPQPLYNYQHMLVLLSRFRKIELNFYSDFEKFAANSENIQTMLKILNELKTEKELFHKYLQQMNTFYKRAMPSKKCNALRYHLRATERAIDDLEDFIKKIKLNKV